MKELEPEAVEWIVIHCTAGRADATLEDIRDYHVNHRGFSDTGYHFIASARRTDRLATMGFAVVNRAVWHRSRHRVPNGLGDARPQG